MRVMGTRDLKYSVLMTVYKNDNPAYFRLSLDSMLNQTYKPDEIVVVKDGPVGTALQDVIDARLNKSVHIKQIQLPINLGLGLALNEGLKHCSNELVARMDADDYSMPKRCELQINAFKENPQLDIVGCPADEFVDDIENIVGCRNVPYSNDDIYSFAKKRDPFNHPTVMYRKATVIEAGMYSDYRKNQDTDLWIKMLSNGAECMNLKEHVFRFRFDEGTYKKRKSWVNTKILLEIRYKAWQSGFNSFFDFLLVAVMQAGVYCLPVDFQKWLYTKVLRK